MHLACWQLTLTKRNYLPLCARMGLGGLVGEEWCLGIVSLSTWSKLVLDISLRSLEAELAVTKCRLCVVCVLFRNRQCVHSLRSLDCSSSMHCFESILLHSVWNHVSHSSHITALCSRDTWLWHKRENLYAAYLVWQWVALFHSFLISFIHHNLLFCFRHKVW